MTYYIEFEGLTFHVFGAEDHLHALRIWWSDHEDDFAQCSKITVRVTDGTYEHKYTIEL